jgi:hypothetical protein
MITFFFLLYNAIDCAYILPLCLFVVFVDVHMIILKARIKEKYIYYEIDHAYRNLTLIIIDVGVYVCIYIHVQSTATFKQNSDGVVKQGIHQYCRLVE